MSEENSFKPSTEDEARKMFEQDTPPVLGKAASLQYGEPTNVIHDLGWIRVKPETLPTEGRYYPANTEITIRAASAAEIRHWSTIDEEDIMNMDDALNKIIEKCFKIRFAGSLGSFKDLKEIDRFFLVFAVRELTFKKGENELTVSFQCQNCGNKDVKPIVKEMLSYYTPVPALEDRYDEDARCFHLKLTNGEELKLYLPTLGVMNYIKSYMKAKDESGKDYDKAFIKWAPFLFSDWRTLNDATFNRMLQDSYAWGTDKISVLDWFVKQMQNTINPLVKNECSVCGEEATSPINFPGGIKSLFLISDITGKLL